MIDALVEVEFKDPDLSLPEIVQLLAKAKLNHINLKVAEPKSRYHKADAKFEVKIEKLFKRKLRNSL